MYGKKILLGLVIALGLAYGVPEVSAEFEATEVVHFGPNEFGGNYDDDFKEGKKKINISYTVTGNKAQMVVKDKSKKKQQQKVFTFSVPGQAYEGKRTDIVQIKDKESGRYFYAINTPSSRGGIGKLYESNDGAWLIGESKQNGQWKIYIDSKNYYSSLQDKMKLLTLRYGKVTLSFREGKPIHSYTLLWNEDKDAFSYINNGVNQENRFNSALVYNPKYRPVAFTDEGKEVYIDVDDIYTEYENDSIWRFEVGYIESYTESDIPWIHKKIEFEVNKNYKNIKYRNDRTNKWSDMNEKYFYHMTARLYDGLVDYSYRIKFGKAYPVMYRNEVPFMLRYYKGIENVL